MTVGTLIIHVGRELPGWDLWCLDSTGTVVDFSSGWTMPSTVVLRQAGVDDTVTATVTANATPSGDGSGTSDTASLSVAPAAGELDALTTGPATLVVVVTHTSSSKDREFQFPAIVKS